MPKWHEFMRPVMIALSETEGSLSPKDLCKCMVSHFSLTEEEQAERLPSGQLRLYNRMYWAITDLEKAGLLSYGNKRGTYHITAEGREFLARHSGPITAKMLMAECESFKKWRDGYRTNKKSDEVRAAGDASSDPEQLSPLETMNAAYGELREALAEELLAAIMDKDPFFFEHLVGKVLSAMGYGERGGSVAVTQKSGDEGIDGIVKEDKLGFDSIYYQAKRWEPSRTVSRPDIQAFVGALSGKGASRGLFITTAKFSSGAQCYVRELHSQKVVLVDGRMLADLMIDYGVGVSVKSTFDVKEIDSDFFEEGIS